MPPKKGKKRKLNAHNGHDASTNGADDLVSPNRSTWPGWVEMESEPVGIDGTVLRYVHG